MYRYLLFNCPAYCSSGGMHDCDLRTNEFDELVSFINEHYNDISWGYIHYYDTVEDKIFYAQMEIYENEDCYKKQRFVSWEEEWI